MFEHIGQRIFPFVERPDNPNEAHQDQNQLEAYIAKNDADRHQSSDEHRKLVQSFTPHVNNLSQKGFFSFQQFVTFLYELSKIYSDSMMH